LTFSIKVSWTPSKSSEVTGYRVEIGTTSGGPYPTVANISGNATSAVTFDGLLGGTPYYGIVTATRGDWTSPPTSEVSVLTPASCAGA
ncbi:MAG: fibronectin type III domain-containing protein, partial [Actinobacteria bacterium]|nr:fibronectin type III domain-containing protein [Actinomycetota bacterium]